MKQEIQEIDILEMAKVLYACKLFILSCNLVGGFLGFAYAYKTVTPMYESSIEVKLPLYCDQNTLQTAVILAGNPSLITVNSGKVGIAGQTKEKTINQPMEGKINEQIISFNDEVEVSPKLIKGTTLIQVGIRGKNVEFMKKFSDIYEYNLINYLNSFVNEKTINAMQIANLQSAGPLAKEELQERVTLTEAMITKKAETPTLIVNYEREKKTILGMLFGFAIGIGASFIKYVKYVIKTNN